MCICASLGIFNLCPVFVCNKCFGRILLEQFIASAATICAVGQIFNLRKQIISCREGAGGGFALGDTGQPASAHGAHGMQAPIGAAFRIKSIK